MSEDQETTVPIEEQAAVTEEFAQGVVDAFGVEGEVSVETDEDEVLHLDVDGSELGLLVGPKGTTISALEELVRTVLQRRTGGKGARIRVDVGGYRARRREALEEFTRQLVEKVHDTGREQALEPMGAFDRKAVHDVVAELTGVATRSEGDEPGRRVIIHPV